MLDAQAPVTACHSEFQMASIYPLMAQRSGRQHIREGGLRHAACSRGSIREKRGGRGLEHHNSSDVFFPFCMIISETALSFRNMWREWLSHLTAGWFADGGATLLCKACGSPSWLTIIVNVCSAEVKQLDVFSKTDFLTNAFCYYYPPRTVMPVHVT